MDDMGKTKQQLINELVEMRGTVSDRKLMEESLKETEERLELALQGADLALWDYNLQTGEAFINPRRAEMVGYAPDELEPHISAWAKLVHPDDRDRVWEAFNAHVEGSAPLYECEHRLRHKAGHYIWVLARAKVVEWDGKGNPVRMVGTSLDITDRKRAEEALQSALDELERRVEQRTAELTGANERLLSEVAERNQAEELLRKSEERYRVLVENANEAIFVLQDGVAKFVNPMCARIMGFSAEELRSRPFVEFIHPDDREKALKRHMQRLRGEEVGSRHSVRVVDKQGNAKWVGVNSVLINWEGRPAVLLLATDITERKHAEENLQNEKQFSEMLIESLPGTFFVFDEEARLLLWNKNLERFSGYSHDEIAKMRSVDFFLGEDRLVIEGAIQEILDQGESSPEAKWTAKDGTEFPYLFTAKRFMHRDKPCVIGTGVDISKRKRLEESLSRAEEFLRIIVDNLPIAVFAKSAEDHRFILWNKASEHLFGFSREQVIGKNDYDFFPKEQADFFWKKDKESLDSGAAVEIPEEPILTKNLGTRILHTRKVPIYEQQGSPQCLLGMSEDITDRKHAEEALRQSEERLALALEGAELSLWDWNLTTGKAVWGSSALEQLGYSPDEIETDLRTWKRMIHPEDWPYVSKTLNDHLAGNLPIYEAEYRMLTKAGDWIWILARGKVIERDRDGRPTRMIGISQDITERKRSEQALLETERRFREVLERVDLLAATIDAEGKIIFCNDFLLTLTGWRREEVLGRNWFDLFVSIEHREARRQAHFDFMRQRKIPPQREHEIVTKSGSPRLVRWASTVLRDVDGRAIGTTGIGEDITERRRAEELLVQTERLRAVADLAGGVAHNFNNLLQVVMGGIDLSLIDLEMGNQSESKKTLEQVLESAKFGAETVRRLQSFARIRPEISESEAHIFDLSEIAQQSTAMTKPWWKTIPEKQGFKVDLHLDLGDKCFVRGKESELFEVLVNLVKNAAEALPSGGDIRIRTCVQDDQVMLQVIDNGVGIKSEHLKNVFDPFWSTKGVTTGTGMGLAVSHGIIRRHGGTIAVESEDGKGAAFTIRLPLAGEPHESRVPSGEKLFPLGLTFLVVDDMAPIVMLLERILTKHEQKVFSAASGDDALEIFRNNKIDVVICDLGMPGMNGWEVGKGIRSICQEKGIPKTPFILLTGWGGQALEEEKIVGSGIDAVVAKPLDNKKLMEVIRKVVGHRPEGEL